MHKETAATLQVTNKDMPEAMLGDWQFQRSLRQILREDKMSREPVGARTQVTSRDEVSAN